MPARRTKELQDLLYIIEEDFSIIKNVSNVMLKCLEEGDFTEIELQSLMNSLNKIIWAYNEQLQKIIRLIEYGE